MEIEYFVNKTGFLDPIFAAQVDNNKRTITALKRDGTPLKHGEVLYKEGKPVSSWNEGWPWGEHLDFIEDGRWIKTSYESLWPSVPFAQEIAPVLDETVEQRRALKRFLGF